MPAATLDRAPAVRRTAFRAMGCGMTLHTAAGGDPRAGARLDAARALIDRAEARLSRFRVSSEWSRLNARSGRPVPVSGDLWEVVVRAMEGARRTNGLYDPAVLDALESAGYDRSFDRIGAGDAPAPGARTGRPPACGGPSWEQVVLDQGARTVMLPPGVRLDFGGIGKAWAAERAAAELSAAGPCLVDAGGDVVARGAPAGWPGWPVGVTDPHDPDRTLTTLALADRTAATSGTDVRRWRRGAEMCHHIIDPRTGRPADTDLWSVTVVAADAVDANVHAVAALVLGSDGGLRYLTAQPGVEALAVRRDGGLCCTPGFVDYIWPDHTGRRSRA
jgi:thiamine biosynthesis lipoprotein